MECFLLGTVQNAWLIELGIPFGISYISIAEHAYNFEISFMLTNSSIHRGMCPFGNGTISLNNTIVWGALYRLYVTNY